MKTIVSAMYHIDRSRLLLTGLVLGVLVRLWIMPLRSSLWLDEFGTYWVSNGGFGEILSRARLFPQSVPYAAVVWFARALGGTSEIVLRLPSLLASGLAAWCLYRLGLELFDRETSFLGAGIFVALPQIAFAASDARPYAFAVLATIGALWMLVRWLERGRARDAIGYAVLATVTIYFHYLFATTLVVHAAYVCRRWRRGCRVRPGHLLLVATGIALLTAPAAVLILELGRDRVFHAFEKMPGIETFVLSLVPPVVVGALLLSFFVCWSLGLVRSLRAFPPESSEILQEADPVRVAPGDALWLLALSVVIPDALLFLISHATGTSVFVQRYMMCTMPGLALLIAWLVRTVQPIGGRRAIGAGYLLIMLVTLGGFSRLTYGKERGDWAHTVAAIRATNGSHPVLMSGLYIEAQNLAWVRDPRHISYMRAPLDFYPTGGTIIILPTRSSQGAESYVETLLDSTPGLEEHFALIDGSSKLTSWADWLYGRLRPRGYTMRQVVDDGRVVWFFQRLVRRGQGPG
jgi:Dolichyl-phosphate-mannose-protein mannosyltransferase